jgi:hypothetical protein
MSVTSAPLHYFVRGVAGTRANEEDVRRHALAIAVKTVSVWEARGVRWTATTVEDVIVEVLMGLHEACGAGTVTPPSPGEVL